MGSHGGLPPNLDPGEEARVLNLDAHGVEVEEADVPQASDVHRMPLGDWFPRHRPPLHPLRHTPSVL